MASIVASQDRYVPPPLAFGERDKGKVGMAAFLITETAFFATLLVTFAYYAGSEQPGPTAKVLSTSIALLGTITLLTSSFTVHLAAKNAFRNYPAGVVTTLAATIGLGWLFLALTGYEWYGLIVHEGLRIDTNLFGSCYYTVVGFHASHVFVGTLMMLVTILATLRGAITSANAEVVELVSWYWHFVDVVWIFVFTIVYLLR